MQCTARAVLYRVRFRARGAVDWGRSKRLLHGSLLALSCDNFESITWATVARRDAQLLGGAEPRIDLAFPEAAHHDFQLAQARGRKFLMAESPACFEVYRHVLQALQAHDADRLPLAPTLLGGGGGQQPPAYLARAAGDTTAAADSDRYAMTPCLPELLKATGQSGFRVLGSWPDLRSASTLDETQVTSPPRRVEPSSAELRRAAPMIAADRR